VLRVKLKAHFSVVANLWMQMEASCALVQNAPSLSLQMKMLHVAMPGRPVRRAGLKVNFSVVEDQWMRMEVHFVLPSVVLLQSLQMQAVCAAPPGRLVLKGKQMAKSVVANL